ncbi:MAG TPA: DUF2027 domain-containing protein [Bacteroidia bacterium]|nr:DUF2027 domain-containing protein [Bacteroidia bacterium]
MEFKIGDRVSFLNEIGGGVIVSIKDKLTVMVSDDDGFISPFLIKKLVKINIPKVNIESEIQLPISNKEHHQISLLFVPKDNSNIFQSDLDLYLVNNSSYNFYFELYFIESDKVLKFAQNQINDGITQLIKSIKREEIETFCKLRFQCLINDSKKMEPIYPLAQVITLKASKFYKESSYQFSGLVNNKAIIYQLLIKEDIDKLKQPVIEPPDLHLAKEFKVNEKISKPNHYLRKAEEVDLHISELLEHQIGLSATQMLQVQLSVFKKELEKAIQLNYASITFIHGIGNGILRESILDLLKEYKGIKFYPASFQKYGNGATKVEIL